MQYGETTLTFTCRPERFLKAGEQSVDVTSPLTIYNPTRFDAKPLLHIEASGSVNIAISGRVMTANVTDYINIDCDTLNAYREPYENKNSNITGEFAKLVPGDNSISITGATLATLKPRYFTI
jgi:phage-related protein